MPCAQWLDLPMPCAQSLDFPMPCTQWLDLLTPCTQSLDLIMPCKQSLTSQNHAHSDWTGGQYLILWVPLLQVSLLSGGPGCCSEHGGEKEAAIAADAEISQHSLGPRNILLMQSPEFRCWSCQWSELFCSPMALSSLLTATHNMQMEKLPNVSIHQQVCHFTLKTHFNQQQKYSWHVNSLQLSYEMHNL